MFDKVIQDSLFAVEVTGPIFIVILLGWWLSRCQILSPSFIHAGSRLSFLVSLPALLFFSIVNAGDNAKINYSLIYFGLLSTCAAFLIFTIIARIFIQPVDDRGVVVQGAFRGNLGVVGLSYCLFAFGQNGLSLAAPYVGFVTVLFNILGVMALTRSFSGRRAWIFMARSIATNPLIVAILAAFAVAHLQLHIPVVMSRAGKGLADLAIPLSLLCVGASLDFQALKLSLGNVVIASILKLILLPFSSVVAAILVGFSGRELGLICLMSCAPTAATSFVVAKAMGLNGVLAANIVAVTTLGSLITTSFFVVALGMWGGFPQNPI